MTTIRDVCRSSAVSKNFRSAAESDYVWNHFLPDEFHEGFTEPEGLTGKNLFFSLVDNPLLLHGTQLSFWLERSSGKKCYMIAARALNITWGDDQSYWRWISHPKTRFKEVAELVHNQYMWPDISGRINKALLSDDTRYAAYFVFKWSDGPCEFPIKASIVMAGTEQPPRVFVVRAELRSDGWHEVMLGDYHKERGDMGELEMHLGFGAKKGLIVHGIEIRPLP